jgi:hypothetical protein
MAFSLASARHVSGLVVPGGVQCELADEFPGGSVDDPDVEILDEHSNVGSGMGAAGADVV